MPVSRQVLSGSQVSNGATVPVGLTANNLMVLQSGIAPGFSPSRNRTVVVGDSRQGFNFIDTYASNFTREFNARGIWQHLQGLSGNFFQLVQAAGVTGDKIADVVSRWASTTPGEMFGGPAEATGVQYGVAPFGPFDYMFVEIGINDITAGLAASQTAAQILASMQASATSLINLIELTGARCVWLTEGAVASGTTNYGAVYLSAILAWNAWLKNRVTSSPSIMVVDAWPLTANQTNGQAATGMIADNTVHYGQVGARARAAAIWSAMQAKWGLQPMVWLPVSNGEVWATGTATTIPNRYPDPLCLNAFVAATGPTGVQAGSVLPSGMAFSNCNGAATVTSSQGTDPDGFGNSVQLDITFGAVGDYVLLNSRNTGSSFVGSEVVRGGLSVHAYGPAGVALTAAHNLQTIKPQLKCQDGAGIGGTTYFSVSGEIISGETTAAMVGNFAEHLISWPITLGAAAPQRVQQLIYIVGAGAGSCRVLLSRFAHFANGGPVG